MIEVHQLPALADNYIYILREPESEEVAVVDPTLARPVIDFLEKRGWKLRTIFNTHHHPDHVGGNRELIARYGCEVVGNAKDRARITGITREVQAGEDFPFGKERVHVFGCDGHTIGHIAYWFQDSKALFCGDTIFSLGCGKLFEGTPEQMWASLSQLRELPDDTLVYCSHEYTLENAAYAITVEPHNPDLISFVMEAKAKRARGEPTVPSLLGDEKAANPFLRPESVEIQQAVGALQKDPLWKIFGMVRAHKDVWDRAH